MTDQFFVGLISVAVALPVDLFLGRAFEIANEGEMPGNWMDAPGGVWKLLLGKDAHNRWALADPKAPVSELVLWLIAGGAESQFQAAKFFVGYALRRLRAALCDEPARDAAGGGSGDAAAASGNGSVATDSSHAARADALRKRLYASAGFIGVYLCWTIFAWFIFTCACLRAPWPPLLRLPPLVSRAPWATAASDDVVPRTADGMLIYRQLGSSAQEEFSKTWGVGYAINNASEWQDVAKTAVQAAIVLVVLDFLRLTKNSSWFEEHGARAHVVMLVPPPTSCVAHACPSLCAVVLQRISCRCKPCCSTAPRAAGGRRRARSSSCRRG